MNLEYYEVLEIQKTSTKDEIKRSYRKLAMKYHPDRNSGDKDSEAKFKKINEAYSVLSNDQKRSQYDRFGKSGMGGGSGFGGGGGFEVNIEDIFDQFFHGNKGGGFSGFSGFSGGGRSNSNRIPGEDIGLEINLTFEESIKGKKDTIEFYKKTKCGVCSGTGARDDSSKETCRTCQGQGRVRKQSQGIFGFMEQVVPCSDCGGSGEIIKNKCLECEGVKLQDEKIEKEIEIPAGIEDGMTMKFEGDGSDGIDAPSGNLFVKFTAPDNYKGLTRDGNNLYYTIDIDPSEAVLGTHKKIKVPIIGNKDIDIKQGINHGEKLIFKELGVTYLGQDKKGDLILTVNISVPKKLSSEERDLYEEIAKIKKLNVKNKKGILEKIFG